ncbi:MAG: ATP-dependent DNA ligase [Rhodobacteraceae bacterium]|nr:ATP-dependent DNA ligase [Paracoccaceae bacterium]
MQRFAALLAALDATTSVAARVAALAAYLREAPAEDRLWTVALLSGRRPKRTVTAGELRLWAAERAGLPDWLFAEAHAVTGDLAETIALVLPEPQGRDGAGLAVWIGRIRALAGRPAAARKEAILAAWDRLGGEERFLFNKLITGGFRMGVSRRLVTRALAAATGLPEALVQERLMGDWDPAQTDLAGLLSAGDGSAPPGRPYPFCLAPPLDIPPARLGDPADWLAEWKWDGIRGQLVRRGGTHHLWSRGEDLITDRFPDLAPLARALPAGTVIDGEILAWGGQAPLPFAALQKRIGARRVSGALLAAAPAVLMGYDLLEWQGRDIRARPLAERRALLDGLVADLPPGLPLRLSPAAGFAAWDELAALRGQARGRGAEGLMLKRRASPYGAGRRRGDWWKWKLDPMTVDAVMIYAQAGHGRRAGLFTDYTFALREGDGLVPFARAYSGLTDGEFAEITDWVRRNTLDRWGPVRAVPPVQVFEIAFEGIAPSRRHRSGIAVRFPRILRWRRDKPAAEIDSLATLRSLLGGDPRGSAPDPGVLGPE